MLKINKEKNNQIRNYLDDLMLSTTRLPGSL